ncbi:MAG: T9SS type A sorting domain-containing protein, partial [Flavobacteriaceae bacterium]|nr:T9SS type A sorting domain-containing protein [Flavobacteriaceae bacterium]
PAMSLKKMLYVVLFLLWGIIYPQEVINVMAYNLLDFPEAPPSNRAEILKVIIDNYQPDLFMVCELQSETAAELILNTSLETPDNRYRSAQFVSNQSVPGDELQQLVFYNSEKLTLISQNEILTDVRDINHYVFNLNNDSSHSIVVDVFVAHLKSSTGYEQERLDMVLDFTTYLASIPKDHYVLMGGDFNLYTSTEPAYQELLDPSNWIVLKDPISRPGDWHNNSTFQDIHTQSTRLSSFTDGSGTYYGAGGGMDDRFDFILISDNLLSSTELSYKIGSYKSYGNNGNCFNKRIDDSTCSGVYSQAIRDILYTMSDHLPVILQLEAPQVLADDNEVKPVLFRILNGNVIENEIHLQVANNLIGDKIIIYNTLGQAVQRSVISNTSEILRTSGLAKGLYFLKIENYAGDPAKFIKL